MDGGKRIDRYNMSIQCLGPMSPSSVFQKRPQAAEPRSDFVPSVLGGGMPGEEAGRRPLVVVVSIVFAGFLLIGIPLPVLPFYVHGTLGFGSVWVGLTIGVQSLATLLTRPYAGKFNDTRGARESVLIGLGSGALAGGLYLVSLCIAAHPGESLCVLLAGRVMLGFSESMLLVGAHSWGIGLLGPSQTGKVMSWNGIAMYGAIAAGAPLGMGLLHAGGFGLVAGVATALPLTAMALTQLLPITAAIRGERLPFLGVVGRIWMPGISLLLATIGFSVIAAFVTLFYASRGWPGAALCLTAFGAANILARVFFAGRIDRYGGAAVAAVSLMVEIVGQLLLWGASSPWMALTGAALSG